MIGQALALLGDDRRRRALHEGRIGELALELGDLAPDTRYFLRNAFDFGRGVDDVFGAPPDNVFLVKISYWLNP